MANLEVLVFTAVIAGLACFFAVTGEPWVSLGFGLLLVFVYAVSALKLPRGARASTRVSLTGACAFELEVERRELEASGGAGGARATEVVSRGAIAIGSESAGPGTSAQDAL
ncbi:MAG TPA: hypothetical protein VF101_08690 [Gaiellaceae bacterium]